MHYAKTILLQWLPILIVSLFLTNCGGGGSGSITGNTNSAVDDEFSRTEYKGLTFYYKNMPSSDYRLNQLTNAEFNALPSSQKLQVADKLLTSLFFGYPLGELKAKITQGNFIDSVRNGLETETTDKGWLEEHILDDTVFHQYDSSWEIPQAITILTRFYAMKELDKYFLHNWVAYILTQTIMFSPAYELSSSHTPNVAGVYNRLVTMLGNESGMRFTTYVHMMSEDNWRRFRSPEDNGREMLEIYLHDVDDSHVPIAGKALKNWKLNTESDTLEVNLNQNRTPLNILTNFFGGMPVISGEDFYRELAKSSRFTSGVTRRLVDFFFPEKNTAKKEELTHAIVSSKPETWQDILLQILFSEEYLLHNNRGQSAEETLFSLTKKIDYRNRKDTFNQFKSKLEEMHQATMKYKLGKLERVPQDSLSFAHYHKYIREDVLMRRADPDQENHTAWNYNGWMDSFIGFEKFSHDSNSDVNSLQSFVDYLFEATAARKATAQEHALFKNHMIELRDGKQLFRYDFNMFISRDDPEDQANRRKRYKRNIAYLVLDYISRLDTIYRQREVH
jgi:hypothetical protein